MIRQSYSKDFLVLAALLAVACGAFDIFCIASAANVIASPDGKVVITFAMEDGGSLYSVDYLGKAIVLPSRLGFEDGFTNAFAMVKMSQDSHAGQWTQVYGERKIVPDNYHELTAELKHQSGRILRITFRAYDEGAALRYSIPGNAAEPFKFTGERTEFRLPQDTFCYEEHGTEGEYKHVKVADVAPWCERPLTLEFTNGLLASLCEADNERFPRMLLSGLPGAPGSLVTALGGASANLERGQRNDGSGSIGPGESSPWRAFVVGQKPGDLLERNYLVLNLNPPLALPDTSWIKPGKAMRDTTLSTTNAKAIIDMGAKTGVNVVGFDARMYGSEDLQKGDATTVRVASLDLPEVIRYAHSKNMGVCVYVDRKQIKHQRDALFPLYEKWGIWGVKIGFVEVGPQDETAWITETIQKAAEHHLVLDIHDGYRPTGYSRTYPNLLTVEGIRGNEHMPTPEHNCTLPFTRFVAGCGDYTVCYFDTRKQTTFAHQLAMAVVSYSPMQWIYWYDKPSNFHDEPELEFFRHVPTVWDDTKMIDGQIGKYTAIARQNGNEWFVGIINSSEPRELKIPLAFLDKDRKYVAHTYSDSDSVATRTHVTLETHPVDSQAMLTVPLRHAGGEAIWIAPVGDK